MFKKKSNQAIKCLIICYITSIANSKFIYNKKYKMSKKHVKILLHNKISIYT